MYVGDDLLKDVVASLLSKLGEAGLKADAARTYVQAVGQVRCVQTHMHTWKVGTVAGRVGCGVMGGRAGCVEGRGVWRAGVCHGWLKG